MPPRAVKIDNPDFPDELRALIRDCIPDLDAMEMLLPLIRQPTASFDLGDLAAKISNERTKEAVARKHLAQFRACGLVEQHEDRYRLAALGGRRRRMLESLARLYNERPVTLVRTIYGLRDERLRALAEAFRFRQD